MMSPRLISRARKTISKALSPILPVKVIAELIELEPPDAKVEVSVVRPSAIAGGRGIPFAPIIVYVNNEEVFRGNCDEKGRKILDLKLEEQHSIIDAYFRREGATNPSDSIEVIWDNFEDGKISPIWRGFRGAGPRPGESKRWEGNGRLNLYCKEIGHLTGIYTRNPVNIEGAIIGADLYSDGYVATGISILPSTEAWYAPAYNYGYDIILWEKAIHKIIIYSGYEEGKKKRRPYSPSYISTTLPSNPARVEIIQIDDSIRFLFNDEQIYNEEYQLPTKICNIYLWAMCWYVGAEGTSWIDNFTFIRED